MGIAANYTSPRHSEWPAHAEPSDLHGASASPTSLLPLLDFDQVRSHYGVRSERVRFLANHDARALGLSMSIIDLPNLIACLQNDDDPFRSQTTHLVLIPWGPHHQCGSFDIAYEIADIVEWYGLDRLPREGDGGQRMTVVSCHPADIGYMPETYGRDWERALSSLPATLVYNDTPLLGGEPGLVGFARITDPDPDARPRPVIPINTRCAWSVSLERKDRVATVLREGAAWPEMPEDKVCDLVSLFAAALSVEIGSRMFYLGFDDKVLAALTAGGVALTERTRRMSEHFRSQLERYRRSLSGRGLISQWFAYHMPDITSKLAAAAPWVLTHPDTVEAVRFLDRFDRACAVWERCLEDMDGRLRWHDGSIADAPRLWSIPEIMADLGIERLLEAACARGMDIDDLMRGQTGGLDAGPYDVSRDVAIVIFDLILRSDYAMAPATMVDISNVRIERGRSVAQEVLGR